MNPTSANRPGARTGIMTGDESVTAIHYNAAAVAVAVAVAVAAAAAAAAVAAVAVLAFSV